MIVYVSSNTFHRAAETSRLGALQQSKEQTIAPLPSPR